MFELDKTERVIIAYDNSVYEFSWEDSVKIANWYKNNFYNLIAINSDHNPIRLILTQRGIDPDLYTGVGIDACGANRSIDSVV